MNDKDIVIDLSETDASNTPLDRLAPPKKRYRLFWETLTE